MKLFRDNVDIDFLVVDVALNEDVVDDDDVTKLFYFIKKFHSEWRSHESKLETSPKKRRNRLSPDKKLSTNKKRFIKCYRYRMY